MMKIPLKQKKKTCCVCGEETYIFSKGRCKLCTQKQSVNTLKRTPLKKAKPKQKNKELQEYFETHIENLWRLKQSEESGTFIHSPSNVNICHLFCKRLHKSVASHLDNCIYLTLDEHTKLDNQYLDRYNLKGLEEAFPNSWRLIIERMRIVRAHITEKTKFVKAFDDFNDTLDF